MDHVCAQCFVANSVKTAKIWHIIPNTHFEMYTRQKLRLSYARLFSLRSRGPMSRDLVTHTEGCEHAVFQLPRNRRAHNTICALYRPATRG